MKYHVCIIGGGAAGLAAAASFNRGVKICLLDKNESLGKKLRATGGGRCNITNTRCEKHEEIVEFFKGMGLETRCDDEGRYFPYSNKASDVPKTLMRNLSEDVDIRCGCEVISLKHSGSAGRFTVEIKGETDSIEADHIILATGGKAAPQYGTTGDGYSIAKSMGHTITRLYPVLTPIQCEMSGIQQGIFRKLKGIRASGKVTLKKDGKPVTEETGEIQFTEDGISGICVFNLTPLMKADGGEDFRSAIKRYTVTVDFAPEFSCEELSGRKSSFGIVTDKLAEFVDVDHLKNWELQVVGVKGWRAAQATAGGVCLDEVNLRTMESRKVEGLYFAGEILDIQGPCGGFNLQNAWETGIKAAKAISESIDAAKAV